MRKVSHYSWDDSEDFVYCFISADRIAWVTVSYLSAPSPYFFFFFLFAFSFTSFRNSWWHFSATVLLERLILQN